MLIIAGLIIMNRTKSSFADPARLPGGLHPGPHLSPEVAVCCPWVTRHASFLLLPFATILNRPAAPCALYPVCSAAGYILTVSQKEGERAHPFGHALSLAGLYDLPLNRFLHYYYSTPGCSFLFLFYIFLIFFSPQAYDPC